MPYLDLDGSRFHYHWDDFTDPCETKGVHDRRDVGRESRQRQSPAGGRVSARVAPHVKAQDPVLTGQRGHPGPPAVQISPRRMVQQYDTLGLPRVGEFVPMVVAAASIQI